MGHSPPTKFILQCAFTCGLSSSTSVGAWRSTTATNSFKSASLRALPVESAPLSRRRSTLARHRSSCGHLPAVSAILRGENAASTEGSSLLTTSSLNIYVPPIVIGPKAFVDGFVRVVERFFNFKRKLIICKHLLTSVLIYLPKYVCS